MACNFSLLVESITSFHLFFHVSREVVMEFLEAYSAIMISVTILNKFRPLFFSHYDTMVGQT